MKEKKAILLFLIFLLLVSCKHGYEVIDGRVYYQYWNEGSGQNQREISNADAKTFRPLDFGDETSFKFAKDKNHFYINGDKMKDIDSESFQYIGDYFFKDKNSVYFYGFYNDIDDCSVKGVNPNNFTLIKYPWAKANNILIHGSDTLTVSDIKSFKPINDDWGTTDKYVIYINKILKSANPKTTKIINDEMAIDGNKKYRYGKLVE